MQAWTGYSECPMPRLPLRQLPARGVMRGGEEDALGRRAQHSHAKKPGWHLIYSLDRPFPRQRPAKSIVCWVLFTQHQWEESISWRAPHCRLN